MAPRLRDRSAPSSPRFGGANKAVRTMFMGAYAPHRGRPLDAWADEQGHTCQRDHIAADFGRRAPTDQPRPSFDRARAGRCAVSSRRTRGRASSRASSTARSSRWRVSRRSNTPPPTGAVIAGALAEPHSRLRGGGRGAHRRLLGSFSRRSCTRPPRPAPPACPGGVRARGQPEADATESLHFGTSAVTSSAAFFSPSSRLAALGTSAAISSIALAHAAAASALARN
jgi:hypothetical protein